jgi:F0F1-type ATP synthase assembly protein I
MLAVQTSKFESKVPMIFLLVGLAVGVLKIVGVVMTLVQCNKQPKAGDASEVANN